MNRGGACVWYFPDGYLPGKTGKEKLVPHESIMLLNVGNEDSSVRIDFYFSDREPIKDIQVRVPAGRIIALRTDHPDDIGGTVIPELTQYAIRLTASHPIVAQFGRLDTTQSNLAYYGSNGFSE